MLNYDLDCKPKDAAGAILIRHESAGEQALLIPRKRAEYPMVDGPIRSLFYCTAATLVRERPTRYSSTELKKCQ